MPIMNKQTMNPGDVYMINGLIGMVTFIDENDRARVIWDDGSVSELPLHQVYEGVPYGSAAEYLYALLGALKAIAADKTPEPLYDDAAMQKAHRTGMLLGGLSTCDDIYGRLLQAGKNPDATFQGAVRIVEQYISGVQHMGVRDNIAAEPKPTTIPRKRRKKA